MHGTTEMMSALAKNRVPGGMTFWQTVDSFAPNISNFPDRWEWITKPAIGRWLLWVGTRQGIQLMWVVSPLKLRAAEYNYFPEPIQ